MDDRARRADARREWPGAIYELGAEPSDDLTDVTTPEERLSVMWELAVRAWSLAGRSMPTYSRADMPATIVRPPR
jgi:hypothetical protein